MNYARSEGCSVLAACPVCRRPLCNELSKRGAEFQGFYGWGQNSSQPKDRGPTALTVEQLRAECEARGGMSMGVLEARMRSDLLESWRPEISGTVVELGAAVSVCTRLRRNTKRGSLSAQTGCDTLLLRQSRPSFTVGNENVEAVLPATSLAHPRWDCVSMPGAKTRAMHPHLTYRMGPGQTLVELIKPDREPKPGTSRPIMAPS